MSEYTFELNAVDHASPVVQEAIQRIRTALEQGSAQLTDALRISPTFNAAELERLVTQLNVIGDRAIEQARVIGNEIGQSLSTGAVPSQAYGQRLNDSLRLALAEMRQQIQQFTESTNIAPGGLRAEGVLQFAQTFQESMLRSIQVVRNELSAQLNAAAREVGLAPRAVTGQFQGARVAGASTTQLIGALGGETPEQMVQRLEAQRQSAADPAAAAEKLVQQVDNLLNSAINAVIDGNAVTQEQLAALREAGLAFDLRNPTAPRGLTPITGPLGVRDIGQGGPSVYQLRPGAGEEFDPVQQTVQLQRALQRAVEVLDQEAAAGEEAAAADRLRAQGTANLNRLVNEGATPVGRFYRDDAGRYFNRGTGAELTGEDPAQTLQMRELDAQYLSMLRRRNTATERLVASQQGADNSFAGLGNRFLGGAGGVGFDAHAGFKPDQFIGNIVGTAGVLARYGATGIAITEAFRAVAEVKTEVVDYQAALEHLDEQIDNTRAGQVDLNAIISAAAPAGIGASEALNLAADALARYGQQVRDGANASQILQQTLDATAQAHVLTGTAAADAQNQVITATQGFQLGPQGQSRILDAIVNAQRNYGGSRADILQAVSQSADLASTASIDPEQLANMVALIQARTGASGSAVASGIERLVSRQGTGNFQQALALTGVQDTGNLTQEVGQLSEAYNKMSAAQQNALIAQLGGARQAQQLLPLLREGAGLLNANRDSYAGAGEAVKIYEREQATVAGQLRQIGGAFHDFFQEIGQSGAFDILGPVIVGFKDAVEGVNALLRAFEVLPRPVRDVALGLAEVLLVLKLIGSQEQQVAVGRLVGNIPVVGSFARRIGIGAAPAAAGEAEAAPVVQAAGTFRDTVVAASEEVAANLRGGGAAAAAEMETGGAASGAAQVAGGAEGAAARLIPGAGTDLRSAAGVATAEEVGGVGIGAAALGLLTNPITYAIGGLIAVGDIKSHVDQLNRAAAQGALGLQALSTARTPEALRTVGDTLTSARQKLLDDSSGPFGSIAGAFTDAGGRADDLGRQAAYARAAAQRIQDQQAQAASLSQSVFGPTGHDIGLGLQAMAQEGVGANTQLRAVAQALGIVQAQAGSAASTLAAAAQQQPSGLTYGPSLLNSLATGNFAPTAKDFNSKQAAFSPGDIVFDPGRQNRELFYQPPRPDDVSRRVSDALGNLKPGQQVTDADKEKIATTIANAYVFGPDGSPQGTAADQARVRRIVHDRVLQNLAGISQQAIEQQTGPITNEDLKKLLIGTGTGANAQPSLLSVIQAQKPDAFDPLGGAGRTGPLRLAVSVLQNQANRADPQATLYPDLILALHEAEDKLAVAQIQNAEKLRQAFDETHPKHHARVDRNYFQTEIALAGADTNQIIGVIDNMSAAEVRLEQAILQDAVKVAEAVFRATQNRGSTAGERATAQQALTQAQANAAAFSAALPYRTPSKGGSNAPDPNQVAVAQLEAQAVPGDAVQNAEVALRVAQYQQAHAKNALEAAQAEKAVNDAEYQLRQARTSLAQAMAGAAAYPGSAISQAAAQLQQARDAVQGSVAGTQEWYAAEAQLKQAQIAYGNAVLQYQANERLLAGDITDPLFRARQTLITAQAQLRADRRRGAPADVLAGDEVAVRQDAAAREAALFQQRMQDAQTLHELGQMSDAAYLRYLEAEQRRLERIKHRTRQETDELYQTEQAIKQANDQLSGQFNLGQIRVPTPYEARLQAALGHGGGGTTTNVQFHFNGANNAQILALLERYLGISSTARYGTSSSKVV